ncbi:RAP domain-containing protein, partial [Durusdinium trenchii]
LHHVPLFAAVRAAWRRRADEFEAQSLANVAWGWAALELRSGSSLMAEVADRARQQMSTFRALPLTNLLWASAVLRCRPEGFMTAASERTQQLIHEHNPQQIANSFWTVAKLSLQNPPLHECLRAATAAALAQFDGQKLANSA